MLLTGQDACRRTGKCAGKLWRPSSPWLLQYRSVLQLAPSATIWSGQAQQQQLKADAEARQLQTLTQADRSTTGTVLVMVLYMYLQSELVYVIVLSHTPATQPLLCCHVLCTLRSLHHLPASEAKKEKGASEAS